MLPAQRHLVAADIENGQATLRVVRKLGRASVEQLLLVALRDMCIAEHCLGHGVRRAAWSLTAAWSWSWKSITKKT